MRKLRHKRDEVICPRPRGWWGEERGLTIITAMSEEHD